MNKLVHRVLGVVAGAVFGVIVLVLVYYVLQFALKLFDARSVRVRIPGVLLFLPLIGALLGFGVAPSLAEKAQDKLSPVWIARLALVLPALWAFVVLGYVLLFEPYGYFMRNDDYLHLAKILSFPTVTAWLVLLGTVYVIGDQGKGGR